MREKLEESADYILDKNDNLKSLSIFLSPVITDLLDEKNIDNRIPYSQIPNFPQKEEMNIKFMNGVPIFDFQYYATGSSMEEIAYPVRTTKFLEIENILMIDFVSVFRDDVDLLIADDHINLMGANPLIGEINSEIGPSFPDMTNTYSESINNFLKDNLLDLGMESKEGILCGINSKYQLTEAQKKYYQLIGADAASYSIVPEAIAAHHVSLNIAALGVNSQRKNSPVLEKLAKLIYKIISDKEIK